MRVERFGTTRAAARDWREYIRAINDTETRQVMLEQEQSERLELAAQERPLAARRVQQLAGSDLGEECIQVLETAAEEDEG